MVHGEAIDNSGSAWTRKLVHTETTDPERGSMTRMRPSRDVVANRLPSRFQARQRIKSLWMLMTCTGWAVAVFQTIHYTPQHQNVTGLGPVFAPYRPALESVALILSYLILFYQILNHVQLS